MVRKIQVITTILLCLLCLNCSRKNHEITIIPDIQKNHRQSNGLKGEVKTVRSTTYHVYKDSTRAPVKLSIFIQNYSADGYLISTYLLNSDSDTVKERQIHYCSDAKQDYWIERSPVGQTLARHEYEYDLSRYLVKEKIYEGDSLICTMVYKNDGFGNPFEMWQNYGTFTLHNEMHYNAQGLLVRENEYDPNGKLFKYITIEHDNYGDEVNRRVFKSGDHLIEYMYTRYDAEGRLQTKVFENLQVRTREIYQYSQHDTQGNWQREERAFDGQPTRYIREREIIYY
ncbi:MAG: hypothetical protein LBR51_03555 [Bacteroidales bacterium]|jgi:hypothetical protein|nr:hypothetical protein [Bacteroidales bacterium]